MPELILSLHERELGRFSIVTVRTTIGRDPGCDVVIDNAGISRLHATIEVVGDSFVLRDCKSQNGITLNGEACHEGRLVDGDIIGLNKFLIKFSNETLAVPENLKRESENPRPDVPRDVQRTMLVGADAARALAERAKAQIAQQRSQLGAGTGSLPPLPDSGAPRAVTSLRAREPAAGAISLPMLLGGVALCGALIAALAMVL